MWGGRGELLFREMDLYFRMKLERSIVHYRAYAFNPLVILMGFRFYTSRFSRDASIIRSITGHS